MPTREIMYICVHCRKLIKHIDCMTICFECSEKKWVTPSEVDEIESNAYNNAHKFELERFEQLKKDLKDAMRSYASTCREECLDFRYDQVQKQIDFVFAKFLQSSPDGDSIQKKCRHMHLRLINSFKIECFDCGLEWNRYKLIDLFVKEEQVDDEVNKNV